MHTQSELLLRRLWVAAKSPSVNFRAHSERVVTHVVVSCLHIHMSLNEGLLSLRVDLEDTLEGSFFT